MSIFIATWIALLALLLIVLKGWGDKQAKQDYQQQALQRTLETHRAAAISKSKLYA